MAQLIIGLDMGAYSVKVVGLERAMRGFLPVFFDEERVAHDTDEEGKLLPYPVRARKALDALKGRGRLRGDIVVTGLPGDLATSRLVGLPFSDPKKIAMTLPFELEAAVPFDLEDVVFDSSILAKTEAEGVDVLVGLAKKQQVQDFLDLLTGVGAEPRYIELEALALDHLRLHFTQPIEKDEPAVMTPGGTVIHTGPGALPSGTAIVDIGASRTTVSISANDEVIAARTILRGGDDLTRALAKEFGLSIEEAEKGKVKESYLETADAPSVYPEQQRISNCLRAALGPLVRELRQTFQGVVARRRVRITRIFLCGGSSRIPNLDRWLARELNIVVQLLPGMGAALQPALPPSVEIGSNEAAIVPQAANAVAFALSGLAGARGRRIDFRQGELGYRGDFEYIRARAPQLAAGFMCLALLGAFNAYARHFVISRQEAAVTQRQRDTCKAILGQSIEGADRCLAIMREKIDPAATGAGAIPSRSALDAYVTLAAKMPKDVTVKVEQLDITQDKIRVKGHTDTFENVDKIVKSLEGGECFKKVEKGPARQEKEQVSWSATVDLECPAVGEVPG